MNGYCDFTIIRSRSTSDCDQWIFTGFVRPSAIPGAPGKLLEFRFFEKSPGNLLEFVSPPGNLLEFFSSP